MAEVAGDLIDNKNCWLNCKHLENFSTEYSETVTNDEEISKERYISPEQRQKIIDDQRIT